MLRARYVVSYSLEWEVEIPNHRALGLVTLGKIVEWCRN